MPTRAVRHVLTSLLVSLATAAPAAAGVHAVAHFYDVSAEPYLLALHVAAGDFNGDGRVDLATADLSMGGGDTTVLFGRGDGSFAEGDVWETDPRPGAIAVGDFDGDGNSDMVFPSDSANTLTLLYGNDDSTFDGDTLDLGAPSNSVAVGHFDDDDALDVVASTPGALLMLLGDGDGGFDDPVPYATGQGYGYVASGDFDGDGRDDVVAHPVPGGVGVLLSNADGSLQAPRTTPPPTGMFPIALTAGRVNADARSDVVLSPFAALALAGADGTLGAFARVVPEDGLATAIGDFNHDAVADLAVSAPFNAAGGVKLLAGHGDGTFATPISIPAPDRTRVEVLADLNGDGFGDAVITDAAGMQVIVAVNAPFAKPSSNTLGVGSALVGRTTTPQSVTIANDGLPPLAISRIALGGANPSEFRVVSDGCSGRTLAAGATCEVAVAGAPAAAGTRAADLAILSNGPDAHVALGGSGVLPTLQPARDLLAPTVSLLVARQRLARVLKRGFTARVGCSEPCTLDADLLRGRARLAHVRVRLTAGGARTVVLKLNARGRRTPRSAKLTLRIRARDAAGNLRRVTRAVRLA